MKSFVPFFKRKIKRNNMLSDVVGNVDRRPLLPAEANTDDQPEPEVRYTVIL